MHDNDAFARGTSAEFVAYQLLLHVMEVEGRPLVGPNATGAKLNRHVILDAYSDCLEAVRGTRAKRSPRVAVAS